MHVQPVELVTRELVTRELVTRELVTRELVTPSAGGHEIAIDIGACPVRVRTASAAFRRLLEERYQGFIGQLDAQPTFDLEVDLVAPGRAVTDAQELRLSLDAGRWSIERGDFHAEYDPRLATVRVRQSANPFAIDALLRVLHSLILARQGGFLVHAASAARGERAFLFAGVSGVGKTTISRLAPAGVSLLTDEISYVRPDASGNYHAYGTPFAGELARLGENRQAKIAALYLLAQGPENRIEPVRPADAVRGLLSCILFFAREPELVKLVVDSACEFVAQVPVHRLTFVPDHRVWESIE